MTPRDWETWLERWFKRHPAPPMPMRMKKDYAQEVLSRIRAEQEQPAWPWRLQPRLVLALGGALAAVLALTILPREPSVLDLERQLREEDRIILAEAESNTMPDEIQALETLEENADWTPEELLEELRQLDASEMEQA